MKGMKALISIGIIVLFSASWYMLINNSNELQNKYDGYLEVARSKAEMGIVTDANNNYLCALEMKDNYELREEIARYYLESKQYDLYESWCQKIISKYPKKADGYEMLATFYQDIFNYYDSFNMIHTAKKRKVKSELLDKVEKEMYYLYEIKGTNYEQVNVFSSDYAGVKLKEKDWGFCSLKGNMIIDSAYKYVGQFTSNGYAPVITMDNEVFLIDANGDKKYIDVEEKNIEEVHNLAEEKMAAKINGQYCYLDKNFKKLFGSYEFASSFNNGIAAVKENGKWSLIDGNGNKINDSVYDDIKLDEKNMAFRNELAFVSTGGEYYMINTAGEKINENVWDDAKLFMSNEPTCVKKNGLWGYINTSGDIVVQPTYIDAKPFANNLAPVCINGSWGYIEQESYQIAIPTEFEEAREVNSHGCAFVYKDGMWSILKLYRLNQREW